MKRQLLIQKAYKNLKFEKTIKFTILILDLHKLLQKLQNSNDS